MKHYLWNMLANIQNGQILHLSYILQKKKKICISLLNVLWNEGFILGFRSLDNNRNTLKIFLKYKQGKPVINSIKPISKPSKKFYVSVEQLWKINPVKGTLIISTNKGLMTLNECKVAKLGGKLFCVLM